MIHLMMTIFSNKFRTLRTAYVYPLMNRWLVIFLMRDNFKVAFRVTVPCVRRCDGIQHYPVMFKRSIFVDKKLVGIHVLRDT